MPDNVELWDKIIADLRGTSGTLETTLEERGAAHLGDHMPFLNYLDQEMFCCTVCGWWCGQEEESSADHGLDEWTCFDCCEEAA